MYESRDNNILSTGMPVARMFKINLQNLVFYGLMAKELGENKGYHKTLRNEACMEPKSDLG